ncbi:hypothetical protein DXT94_00275 [Rhizobium sp. ICMP 5592]|nr:hypothetical protein [Rhizobium sp. ICMP 5592]
MFLRHVIGGIEFRARAIAIYGLSPEGMIWCVHYKCKIFLCVFFRQNCAGIPLFRLAKRAENVEIRVYTLILAMDG